MEQVEGEKPCKCIVLKHPLVLTEGPRKEGNYPRAAHLAALLVSVGEALTPALYPRGATGN